MKDSPRLLRIFAGSVIAAVAIFIISCGGGGGGGSTTAGSTFTGSFIDAPTQGVHYSASPSGLSGTTDASGHFQYQPGDTVTFSIDVGGGTVTLGSFTPAPGGNPRVFVLALPDGQQIAQVLQSLDHGTGGHMDVSGLTLSSADVGALNTFISTGQPPSGQTDQQLLNTVQQHAGLGDFTHPGGVSAGSALATAISTVAQMTTQGTPADAGKIVTGNVLFDLGFGTKGLDIGFTYFNADTSGVNIQALLQPSTDPQHPGTVFGTHTNTFNYTTSGNQVTVGTVVASLTGDTTQGLYFKQDSSDNSSGAGAYFTVQTALSKSAFAGKALTVTGVATCPNRTATYEFSADGSSFTAFCGTAAGLTTSTPILDVGTVADNLTIAGKSFPDLVDLTGTCSAGGNIDTYLGLLNGNLDQGILVGLIPSAAGVPGGGANLFGVSSAGATVTSLLSSTCVRPSPPEGSSAPPEGSSAPPEGSSAPPQNSAS